MSDLLHQFSFDGTDVRGELAQLELSLQDATRHHHYPMLISQALGELLAATALLSANLKFPGRLTLQVRLGGSIRLLQAETNEKGELRAIARFDEQQEEAQLSFVDGQMVITVEPESGQRYQGITAIAGGNVAQALEEYFLQSEQLPTRFWLAANDGKATGFMLQKVPAPAGTEVDEDAWDRLNFLAATVKQEELLELPAQTLLQRLFHEENTRVYPASPLRFHCTCSKERLGSALRQVGYSELDNMLAEMGRIDIHCEFCQQPYLFERSDIEALFPERHLQ